MTLKQAMAAVKKAKKAVETVKNNREKTVTLLKIGGIVLAGLGLAVLVFLLIKKLKKAKKEPVFDVSSWHTDDADDFAFDEEEEPDEPESEEDEEEYADFSSAVADLEKKVGGLSA